jgi:formyltetrahydrofolate-dependent phosphoribosylglycinamide formyltransferase
MNTVRRSRLAVLVSGSGSNLQALIDASVDGQLPAEIVLVVSNRAEAYGLERARRAGIPAVALPKARALDRRAYDLALSEVVAQSAPDWVVLAGWMRLLSRGFLDRFPNRVVNLHPALPGQFPGTHAIERALQAYRAGEITHTGVMVHLVPDEGVDSGPVLGQTTVPIEPEDTLESLSTRVHVIEHQLLVATLARVIGSAQPVA